MPEVHLYSTAWGDSSFSHNMAKDMVMVIKLLYRTYPQPHSPARLEVGRQACVYVYDGHERRLQPCAKVFQHTADFGRLHGAAASFDIQAATNLELAKADADTPFKPILT
jgi:hypothetical protein